MGLPLATATGLTALAGRIDTNAVLRSGRRVPLPEAMREAAQFGPARSEGRLRGWSTVGEWTAAGRRLAITHC